MTTASFLLHLLLLSTQPGFRFKHDRREFEGERYVELCGGLYQQPETWVCVQVTQ